MYVLKINVYLFAARRVFDNTSGKPLQLICACAKCTTQMEWFLNTYFEKTNLTSLIIIVFQKFFDARNYFVTQIANMLREMQKYVFRREKSGSYEQLSIGSHTFAWQVGIWSLYV